MPNLLEAVMRVSDGNTANLVDSTHPVKTGDALVIYCAGLGSVSPAGPNDAAAVSALLSQTENGHKSGRLSFSGLTPGFVSVYQVNVAVPADVTPGNEVPVVIAIAGQGSPVGTISVQ